MASAYTRKVQIGFLDRISVAAREPVYSAVIAWMLDDDSSPLSIDGRLAILESLCGRPLSGAQSIRAETEWNDIDLFVTVTSPTTEYVIAIENKLKASEGIDQLSKYETVLTENGASNAIKIFLTLAKEVPASGSGWIAVSYRVLLDAVWSQQATRENPFLADICDCIRRLVGLVERAEADQEIIAAAFNQRSPTSDTSQECISYMRKLRLEKVVQRIWIRKLADKVNEKISWEKRGWQTEIAETRGQALFTIKGRWKDNPACTIGVQLQHHSLKAFVCPTDYRANTNDHLKGSLQCLLRHLQHELKLNSKFSNPGPRGFSSVQMVKLPKDREYKKWVDAMIPCLKPFIDDYSNHIERTDLPV